MGTSINCLKKRKTENHLIRNEMHKVQMLNNFSEKYLFKHLYKLFMEKKNSYILLS